jgi:NDP-sugar pyrophosphorylase family protein
VEIAGHTLLEITILRLRQFGVREIIINVHHFADKVIEYLQSKDHFGIRIEVSREDMLLDTGGGLKKAAWFFLENGAATAPFILHNVDVISDIDLGGLVAFHQQNQALATLAVQQRESSRYLLFDEQMRLCGRRFVKEQKTELTRPAQQQQERAFTGVHVISPRLLPMIDEQGVFSIIETYLRLTGQGEKIIGSQVDSAYWRDMGKPENVIKSEEEMRNRAIWPSGHREI